MTFLLLISLSVRAQGHFLLSQFDSADRKVNYVLDTDGKTVSQIEEIDEGIMDKRTLFFINGHLYSEEIAKGDTPKSAIYYFKNGHIKMTCSAKIGTDSIYQVNGIVNYFSIKGKLNISSYYELGHFKKVIYYRNNSIYKKFLRGNKDYPMRWITETTNGYPFLIQ